MYMTHVLVYTYTCDFLPLNIHIFIPNSIFQSLLIWLTPPLDLHCQMKVSHVSHVNSCPGQGSMCQPHARGHPGRSEPPRQDIIYWRWPMEDTSIIPKFMTISGWWFGTFFIFPYIGKNHPTWLICFRGVFNHQSDIMNMFLFFLKGFMTIPWYVFFSLQDNSWQF